MSIQDYQILSKLGSGSFGVVHKARDKKTNLICVIKIVDVSNMNAKLKKNAMEEGRILKQVNSPYIVKHFNTFIHKSSLNIVMQYCPKGDLTAYMKGQMGKPLKQQTIWKFSIQMIGGLRDLHAKKILHRDIKSLNVFLDDNYNAKIGDLGVAKTMTGQFAHTIVGTPYYLSPQMCQQKPYNEKTDIWALGCVIYELCTGKRPFQANNQAALALKIVMGKYQNLPSHYSSDLIWVIKSCLALDYKRRPSASYILGMPKVRQWATKLNIIIDVNNYNKLRVEDREKQKQKQKQPQKPKNLSKQKQKPKLLDNQYKKQGQKVQTPKMTPKSAVKQQKGKQREKIVQNKIKLSKQAERNVKQVLNKERHYDLKPPKYSGAKRFQMVKQQQKQMIKPKVEQKQINLKSQKSQSNTNNSIQKKQKVPSNQSRQYFSQPSSSGNFKDKKDKTMNATMNRFLPEDFRKKKEIDIQDSSKFQQVVLLDQDSSSEQQKKPQKPNKNLQIFQKGQQLIADDQLMKQFGLKEVNPKRQEIKEQSVITHFNLQKKPLSIDWNQIDGQKQQVKKNRSLKMEQLPTVKNNGANSPQKLSQMKINQQNEQEDQNIDQQINENRAYISDDEEQTQQQKSQQLLIEDLDQKQQDLNLKKKQNQKRKAELQRMKNHFQPQLLKFMTKNEYENLKIKIMDCKEQQVQEFVANWKNNLQCVNLFYRIIHFEMQIKRCLKNLDQIDVRLQQLKKQKN